MLGGLSRLSRLPNLAINLKANLHASNPRWAAKNYYEILALSQNASQAEVKKAYYSLAKKYHPDRNPDDPRAAATFQNISEAYEVLGDQEKRKEYDSVFSSFSFGHSGKKSKSSSKRAWSYNLQTDPYELFKRVFGDISANFAAAEDHTSFAQQNLPRALVSISYKEAASGVSRSVKFLKTGSDVALDEILVNIPPGIEDGQTLRLKIDGTEEAIVQVQVDDSSEFRREGFHVHSETWVNIWEAGLGSIVQVPGLQGSLKVKLPKQTSSHTVLVLPNQGFPKTSAPNSSRGDHFLTVKIRSLDINKYRKQHEDDVEVDDKNRANRGQ